MERDGERNEEKIKEMPQIKEGEKDIRRMRDERKIYKNKREVGKEEGRNISKENRERRKEERKKEGGIGRGKEVMKKEEEERNRTREGSYERKKQRK